jgi:hypothetical protein
MHAWGLCGTSMYSWSPGRTGWQIKVWYVACGAPGFEVLYIDNSHGEERYRVVIRRADNKADWGRFCGGLLSSRGLTMAFQGGTGVALVIKWHCCDEVEEPRRRCKQGT